MLLGFGAMIVIVLLVVRPALKLQKPNSNMAGIFEDLQSLRKEISVQPEDEKNELSHEDDLLDGDEANKQTRSLSVSLVNSVY